MATQNKVAATKYGSKATAEKAFREKMATSNSYTSATPPATRPTSVPQSITVNNTSINTSYDRLPGGGYGYGYYDPTSHLFMALAVNQMIVNDAMMAESGYGRWGHDGRPVQTSGAGIVLLWFFGFLVIVTVIVIVYANTRK
jgi:hypothetical protein